MNVRKQKYFVLNSKLTSFDDKEIHQLLDGNHVGNGWGTNHIVKLGGSKLFVKSIPLTSLEYKNSYSTKNLFKLPLYYNYGVGSAGLGAFREINTHVKTTNWVLNDEIDSFPLMYHYRIIKKTKPVKKLSKQKLKKHHEYIKYWNNSKAIHKYIMERKTCEYEIIIFLEFIPYVFNEWLKPNISRINEMSKKVFKAFDFLKSKGIIHFDAHFGNILTDGKNVFLTDFGLSISREFDLNKSEKEFFRRHKQYDYAEYIGCTSGLLESLYQDQSKKVKKKLEIDLKLTSDLSYYEKVEVMLNHLDEIKRIMSIPKSYYRYIKKNMETIKLSNNFFYGMRKDFRKKEIYPHSTINKQLKKLGVL